LTGTLQNFARRNNVPIDRVNFDYNIQDKITHEDIKEAPEAGCMIYGLFLEGCKWDYNKSALAESDPKKLFVDLPLMHLMPIVDRKKPEDGIYMTPMYRVLSRTGTLSTTGHSTNFVIMLELSSKEDQDKWILAGVACMCSLRY
jgi:dynein heavy chain